MTIRIALIFALSVGAMYVLLAQKRDRIDSLRTKLQLYTAKDNSRADLMNALSAQYYHLDFDSAYRYGHMALELSKQIDYDFGMAESYKNLGFAYIPWALYDSSKQYFDSCLAVSDEYGFDYVASEAFKGLGIAYEESGRYQQSLEAYYQSLTVKRSIGDIAGLGKIHNNLGQVFRNMGELDSATNHLLMALENEAFLRNSNDGASSYLILGMVKLSLQEFEEAKDMFRKALFRLDLPDQVIKVASSNGGLGRAYLEQGNIDSAKYFLQLGLDQFSTIRHIGGQASLTALLAEAFRSEGNCDSALYYSEKGIRLRRTFNNMQYVAREMTFMSQCLVTMGYLERAASLTKEAVTVATKFGSKSEAYGAYSLLHEIYSKQGRYQKAYEMMKLSAIYRDSVLNQQRLNEINRLENEYEISTIKKERELVEAKARAEELRLKNEISRGKWIQFGTIAGTVVLIIVILIMYYSLKQKRRDNALIAQKNTQISINAEQLKSSKEKLEELTSFREGMTQMIAHDMKNTLNTIIGYSSAQSSGELKHVNHAGRQMLGLVTNMLDIQKFEEASMKIKKRQFSLEQLLLRASDQVGLLLAQKDLRIEQNLENDMLWVDPDIFDRVLVNLITNAIKYSDYGSRITLSSVLRNNQYVLSLGDEGVGIEKADLPYIFDKFWQGTSVKPSGASASTGLGLTFCKMAVEAHEGSIEVTSEPGTGTTITIHLPLQKNESVTLDGQEVEQLKPFIERLLTKEVDEVGAIKDVLNEIEGTQPVENWKMAIESAIANGDQQAYETLLEVVLSGKL